MAHEVADLTQTGSALAPEVSTVCSAALRCRGLVDDDVGALIEAVELARRAPRLVEHAGASEDAAAVLAAHGRRDDAAVLLREALARDDDAGTSRRTPLPKGQLVHAAGPTPGGWTIIALRDSRESWEDLRDGVLVPALQRASTAGSPVLRKRPSSRPATSPPDGSPRPQRGVGAPASVGRHPPAGGSGRCAPSPVGIGDRGVAGSPVGMRRT